MASSKPLTGSIRKGQIALVCELCENDPKLKWKCLDCGRMMCQRCRDIVHPKFPSAQDHTIKPVNTTFSHVPQFVPGDIRNIKTTHGKLEEITTPYNTDIKIVQDFYTDLGIVSSLAVCPKGALWIKDDYLLKILQKVTPEGDKLKIQSKFQISVEDMRLTPSGDLLLCVEGSSVVKVIPSGTDDVKNSPYNVSPLLPIGIHVTHDNTVIIGATDARPYFPAEGPRQVILLDQSGRQEKVFQFDGHNIPLFTLPYRVTSTSKGNIGVVDMFSDDYQGRVVILNNEGGIINIYTGHPDVNTEHNPFTPIGIVTTTSDNFVISDYDNHKLHILSSDGEIITYYNTEKLGIELPRSLSFSHTGQLYIGCDTTYQGSDENKIYKIDNFIM